MICLTGKTIILGTGKIKGFGRMRNELQTQDSSPLVSASLKLGAGRVVALQMNSSKGQAGTENDAQ